MRVKLYNFLVNRQTSIRNRYRKFRDNATGARKYLSWLYLLWLNLCFYVFHVRFSDKCEEIYERKKLETKQSESGMAFKDGITVSSFVERLSGYDVVSFDIFDTLIFRPFSEPTDLFFLVGERLGKMDYKDVRRRMEQTARQLCYKKNGHYEVTLQEILEEMEKQTGWQAEKGLSEEIELEKKFCYANPFMLEVYEKLLEQEKKIIIVSDMYLPADVLKYILEINGYKSYAKLYVSSQVKKSKAKGDLYELVRKEMAGSIIHVGDNKYSDVTMAEKHGVASCWYPNVNDSGNRFRSHDMSAVIGGAYRGIVNNRIYRRTEAYSMEYEYGFIYGGLPVLGYCTFIHEYCKKNSVDKVLFLSRDGEILKKAYDILFPEEQTEYVYWSRRVATKLMAKENRYDFLRRFLSHKMNQGFSLESIFVSMELEILLEQLPNSLSASEELTDKNVNAVKEFVADKWTDVIGVYEREHTAAKAYYREVLSGCKKAVAVDIGWAGSGAVALNYLVQNEWNLSCEIIGLIAGTNTMHDVEPDASEMFLQSGKLVAYMYSQAFNRDVLKKHDSNRNYNVYWELLFASPTPQFIGFSEGDNQECEMRFGEDIRNTEGIREIQSGVLAFVQDYKDHFEGVPYLYHISGRDAYAPMLVAASYHEKYLKAIEKRFGLEKHVS